LRNILHVAHQWGGGISTYIEDLTISSKNYYHIYKLKCWQGIVYVEYERDGVGIEKKYNLGEDIQSTDFSNNKYAKILSSILDEFDIDIVHINTQIGHTFDIFTVPALRHIPIVCTVHDYFYICPAIHLVDTRGEYCGICLEGTAPYNCLEHHSYLFYIYSLKFGRADLDKFRQKFRSVIHHVDVFVFPSHSARGIFSKYYGIDESVCRVIYHGTTLFKSETLIPEKEDGKFHVGIIGSMFKHKGQATIQALIASLRKDPVKFFHFGDGDLTGENLEKLGKYNRNNIVELIQSKKIDVSLLLSTWPETFSYTLTESIAANVPAIVTDMGALAERVSADKIGWLVDYKDVGGIRDLILRLSREKGEIEKYKKRLTTVKLKAIAEMHQEYMELYDALLSDSKYKDREKNMNHCTGDLLENNEDSAFGKYIRLKWIFINSKFLRAKNKVNRFFLNS
jgi:glycosyltransferase involved in cell wall biosynthesis